MDINICISINIEAWMQSLQIPKNIHRFQIESVKICILANIYKRTLHYITFYYTQCIHNPHVTLR